MARVLITGGAGYIGSVLTSHLLMAGHFVRVIDRLIFGGAGLRGYIAHPRFEFHYGDITDQAAVRAAMDTIDTVVHLAAIVGDPACRAVPDLAERVNRQGARITLEQAVEHGVGRFVFASTCSNYGQTDDPDRYVDEQSPLNPISLYAELKVEFERILLGSDFDNMVPIVLRFATAFGISPRPRFDLVVNEFSRDLYERRVLEVFGETTWRPYCHVADISEAVRRVIEADPAQVQGQAFNVGSTDENYRKKDIVNLILEQLPDREKLVRYVFREEDPRDYRVAFDKIRERLEFCPRIRVPQGIENIILALRTSVVDDSDNPRYRNDNREIYARTKESRA